MKATQVVMANFELFVTNLQAMHSRSCREVANRNASGFEYSFIVVLKL